MYIDCCTKAYGDQKCKACDGVGQHVFSLYVLPQRSVLLQNKSFTYSNTRWSIILWGLILSKADVTVAAQKLVSCLRFACLDWDLRISPKGFGDLIACLRFCPLHSLSMEGERGFGVLWFSNIQCNSMQWRGACGWFHDFCSNMLRHVGAVYSELRLTSQSLYDGQCDRFGVIKLKFQMLPLALVFQMF